MTLSWINRYLRLQLEKLIGTSFWKIVRNGWVHCLLSKKTNKSLQISFTTQHARVFLFAKQFFKQTHTFNINFPNKSFDFFHQITKCCTANYRMQIGWTLKVIEVKFLWQFSTFNEFNFWTPFSKVIIDHLGYWFL